MVGVCDSLCIVYIDPAAVGCPIINQDIWSVNLWILKVVGGQSSVMLLATAYQWPHREKFGLNDIGIAFVRREA